MDRNREAELLQKSRLLPQLLDEIKSDQIEKWETTDTSVEREQCWMVVHTLELLREGINERIDRILRDGGDD